MPTISRTEAIDKLNGVVSSLSDDDLVEVYNELFPGHPTDDEAVRKQKHTIVQGIEAHIRQGLEVEEIVDLWNVIFPRYRNVWFDENSNILHCEDEPAEDDSGLSSISED